MNLTLTDAGRSTSHPKEKNDCTVRALATALQRDYGFAHEALEKAGRQDRKAFAFNKFMKKQKWGYWKHFAAVKGKPRMKLTQFLLEYPRGTYILKVARHVFTVIDGQVFDDCEPRLTACIYGAWRIPKDNPCDIEY